MRLIVGLGNPGKRYSYTRHNIGFIIVDALVEKYQTKFSRSLALGAYVAHLRVNKTAVLAAKPRSFMNNSGQPVEKIVHKHKIFPQDILVVHDEADLPFGRIKFKKGGSCAGHRGVESVSERIGTGDFLRLRVGIGKPEGRELTDYVLENFSIEQNSELGKIIHVCLEAIEEWAKMDVSQLMSKYNAKAILPS